jgi:hypothetical protein
MREYKPEQSLANIEYGVQVLQNILDQPGPQQKRPCPTCTVPCACSRSTSCTCQCSWKCPFLSIQLSSDPVKYPIESKIIPLVYAVNSLQVCPSYWSCEGHENDDGGLRHSPRVNFYSDSVIIPSLLTEYFGRLYFQKVTSYRWKITSLGMTSKFQAQYMIEPDIMRGVQGQLKILQADVFRIANCLYAGVNQDACSRLAQIKRV